jgi:hypothetical protein
MKNEEYKKDVIRLNVSLALRELAETVLTCSIEQLDDLMSGGEFGRNLMLDTWEKKGTHTRYYDILSLVLKVKLRAYE